ncbi:hypothetical protein [Dyella subtropica]|uniref:hypothetical protein n=1 Tax=Dyella subtropica TaxID=2992127 RepID=UPI00224FE84E|nr:hypothetical protein [Dyella subtropica]
MESSNETLLIYADRDSVCAGDDGEAHERPFAAPMSASVHQLIELAQSACCLATIAGGHATWIVEAGGHGGKPIAVVAQQWQKPRLLVAESETVGRLFAIHKAAVFFKYWCQADPECVFEALMSGTSLPGRYA